MVSKIMKRCSNCGADTVVAHNVQDGSEFCPSCAPPSFSMHSILTLEDIRFMKECGVDPGLSPALRSLVELASNKQSPFLLSWHGTIAAPSHFLTLPDGVMLMEHSVRLEYCFHQGTTPDGIGSRRF